jgi:hypothetical protein
MADGHAGVGGPMWLEPMPVPLRQRALESLDVGDVAGFLGMADNVASLTLVYLNTRELQRRGLYEATLLEAFAAMRANNRGASSPLLDVMWYDADRSRLRAAGDPLQGDGPFTVYRGVAGHGAARRIQGFSWTSSLEMAGWFAARFRLPHPAVFTMTVDDADALAYRHRESEFIVRVESTGKCVSRV